MPWIGAPALEGGRWGGEVSTWSSYLAAMTYKGSKASEEVAGYW